MLPSLPPMGQKLPQLLTYKIVCLEYHTEYIVTATKVESVNETLMFYRFNELVFAIPSRITMAYKQPIE